MSIGAVQLHRHYFGIQRKLRGVRRRFEKKATSLQNTNPVTSWKYC